VAPAFSKLTNKALRLEAKAISDMANKPLSKVRKKSAANP
jgi:hypothetical protein